MISIEFIKRVLRDYFLAIFLAGVAALVLRVYVIEAFRIPTDLMSPTLVAGDHIFVNKLNVNPKPGDIVVFSFPNEPTKDYIKRVIGVAGDTIEIKDAIVYVNGKPISKPLGSAQVSMPQVFEEHLGEHSYRVQWGEASSETKKMMAVTVPDGKIFVLGDYRTKGQDSRGWGFVSISAVQGKASLIWFSRNIGVQWSRLMQTIP